MGGMIWCFYNRFVFIIGTSVVLAFSSMRRREVGRLQLLRKLSWRTVVLMLIGFCFMNYSPKDGLCMYSMLWLLYFCLFHSDMLCQESEINTTVQLY